MAEKDSEIIKLKELIEKAKQEKLKEEELFDNARDLKDKELHLSNIHELDTKLIQLSVKLKELNGTHAAAEEDSIKAPFNYVAKEEEYGFGGVFRTNNEEE